MSATTCTVELWGAERVAEELCIAVRSVWRMARQNRLPARVPIAGQEWAMVWLADDIRAYIESL